MGSIDGIFTPVTNRTRTRLQRKMAGMSLGRTADQMAEGMEKLAHKNFKRRPTKTQNLAP